MAQAGAAGASNDNDDDDDDDDSVVYGDVNGGKDGSMAIKDPDNSNGQSFGSLDWNPLDDEEDNDQQVNGDRDDDEAASTQPSSFRSGAGSHVSATQGDYFVNVTDVAKSPLTPRRRSSQFSCATADTIEDSVMLVDSGPQVPPGEKKRWNSTTSSLERKLARDQLRMASPKSPGPLSVHSGVSSVGSSKRSEYPDDADHMFSVTQKNNTKFRRSLSQSSAATHDSSSRAEDTSHAPSDADNTDDQRYYHNGFPPSMPFESSPGNNTNNNYYNMYPHANHAMSHTDPRMMAHLNHQNMMYQQQQHPGMVPQAQQMDPRMMMAYGYPPMGYNPYLQMQLQMAAAMKLQGMSLNGEGSDETSSSEEESDEESSSGESGEDYEVDVDESDADEATEVDETDSEEGSDDDDDDEEEEEEEEEGMTPLPGFHYPSFYLAQQMMMAQVMMANSMAATNSVVPSQERSASPRSHSSHERSHSSQKSKSNHSRTTTSSKPKTYKVKSKSSLARNVKTPTTDPRKRSSKKKSVSKKKDSVEDPKKSDRSLGITSIGSASNPSVSSMSKDSTGSKESGTSGKSKSKKMKLKKEKKLARKKKKAGRLDPLPEHGSPGTQTGSKKTTKKKVASPKKAQPEGNQGSALDAPPSPKKKTKPKGVTRDVKDPPNTAKQEAAEP